MPLHLLHHKSYHVYNAANIARVRHDEAAAAAAATAATDLAESRAASDRLSQLRAHAACKEAPSAAAADEVEDGISRPGVHIDLFPERAEERKKEQRVVVAEDMGNALGGKEGGFKPWYSTGERAPEVAVGRRGVEEARRRDRRWKEWGDPLRVVERGVGALREVEVEREEWRRGREREVGGGEVEEEEEATRQRWRRKRSRSPGGSGGETQQRRRRRREGTREEGARRHSGTGKEGTGDADRMARLRAEREQREAAERDKARDLLRREQERDAPGWKAVEGGRYSRQFGGS